MAQPAPVGGEAKYDAKRKDEWGIVDVSDWVRNWTNGTWANHGIRMDTNGEGMGSWKKLASSENNDGTAHLLLIDYNPPISPSPPPNPVATANIDGTVGVTWGNSSTQGGSPIDFYVGYSFFADGTYSGEYQIRYCTANCNYALFSNVPQNQSQKFRIYAHNTAGKYSTPTDSNLVTPRVVNPPSPPTNPSALDQGGGTVKVAWNLSASDGGAPMAQYMTLAYRQVSGSFAYEGRYSSACGTCDQTTFNDLLAGNTYRFDIYANNGVHNSASPAITTISLAVPSGPPTTPTGVGANAGDQSANVGWSPSTADTAAGATIASYQVQAYNGTTPVLSPLSVAGDKTSTVFSGLTNGQPYNFKVTATDSLGKPSAASSASNTVIPEVSGVARSDQNGLEDFYPYRAFELGQGTAFANMASGNLVVQDEDFNVPGQGLNMRLVRTYNASAANETAAGPFGQGWRLGVSDGGSSGGGSSGVDLLQILRIVLTGNPGDQTVFDMVDIDGTKHRFIREGGVWKSPPGVNLKLTETAGNTFTFTRPDGLWFEFSTTSGSADYRVGRIGDRKGNTLRLEYTADRTKLVKMVDDFNRTITFEYTGAQITKATFAAAGGSLATGYGYDSSGRLQSVTDAKDSADARTTSYEYSGADALLSKVTDPRGNSTQFAISGGKLNSITDRAGKIWTFTTGAGCPAEPGAAQAICITDPEDKTQVWSRNAGFNLLAKRDEGDKNAAGATRFNTRKYTWLNNRLEKAFDEANLETAYLWTDLGSIKSVSRPGGDNTALTTTFDYNPPSPQGWEDLTKTTTRDRITQFFPNADGTLEKVIDPENKATSFSYHQQGSLLSPPIRTGLLASVTDANGGITRYGETGPADRGYDPSGSPKRIEDARTYPATYKYDFLGRMFETTDREGKLWKNSFDLRGNLRSAEDPEQSVVRSCYDQNDNLTLVVPARSGQTPSCSAAGVDSSLDGEDGYSTKISYDARDLTTGSKTRSVTTSGNVSAGIQKTEFKYFDDGQLKEVWEPKSFDKSSGDAAGTAQKTSYELYDNNRLKQVTGPSGAVTTARYESRGLPEFVTDPQTSANQRATMTYAYNQMGQVISAKQSAHDQPATSEYNAFGMTS